MSLTNQHWAVLEPLVEASIWPHANRAKWRSILGELGPWWAAARPFIRWAKLGVWERLLRLAQGRGAALGMPFLDRTSIRAHQKAAGALRKGGTVGVGRERWRA